MTCRREFQADIEARLVIGNEIVEELKTIMDEGGPEISEHAKGTLALAERMLASGRRKLEALAAVPDDQFDDIVAQTQESWKKLSSEIEDGWRQLSDKIQNYFS